MRLTLLSLSRYGNFESERISFDPRPGVVNVLLAPNGAGKSVLRSAFCDLLFGIGGQTPMGFRFGYGNMRIVAEAIDLDGTPFGFGRRKGMGNTLIDADGASLPPQALAARLGLTDRTLLERLFALDTERLRQGEKELLASNGAVADALESGSGGFHHARRLRDTLIEQRDKLAPLRRSSQRPFYVHADKFAAARRETSKSALRPEEADRRQRELDAARQQQQEQNLVADATSAEIARLERLRRVRPLLAAHDDAAAWLADHPDAPQLDPALGTRLNATRSAIVIADQRLQREREAVERLGEQFEQVKVDTALLAEADAIDGLGNPEGAARKAALDLPTVAAQAEVRRQDVAARLRDLGSSLSVERAAEAIPPRTAISRARRLLRDHAARQQAVQAAPAQVAAAERERDAAVAQLASLAAGGDLSDLEALLKEIRADGDPARRQLDAETAAADAERALADALARVPGWDQGLDALIALHPLTPDHYERMADEMAKQRGEAARLLDTLRTARLAADEARARLDSLTGATPLPDDAALERSRERRDIGWQLIYRRAFTADLPTAAEEQAFAGPLPLPLAYERAVTAADDVADRQLRQAEDIERFRSAQSSLQEANTRMQAAETAHKRANETAQATVRAWEQVCSVFPLGQQTALREVLAFHAARERVLEARQRHAVAEAAEQVLTRRRAEWATRLAMRLAQPPAALPTLLILADRQLAEAQRADKARAGAEARRTAAEKALADAQTRQRDADAALDGWKTEWAQAAQALQRPADEDPDVTNDLLQVFADLETARAEAASLAERVAGMQRDNSRFAEMTLALAGRVAPDLGAGDPYAQAAALRQRLQHAREQARQRDLLAEQLQGAKDAAAAADRQLAEAQAEQRATLLLIGADDLETAAARLELAAQRAQHATALGESETRLREAGDLLPLATLRAEVAAVPADDIPARIEHAGQRRHEAQAAAQAAAASAAALSQELARSENDTAARDAAANQQAAVATVGRVLEEALVYHLAAEMLERALAAVEQDADTALLRRVSSLFSRLTGGAYARVLSETDETGTPRLTLLQHAFPDEQQAVSQLSEGTRDQLYLALRLAAIEDHARNAPPLPFIGDDILQTFDDDRALAAMDALREVSHTVQVILLTHHRHVLDLARRLPEGSVHACRIGTEALLAAE